MPEGMVARVRCALGSGRCGLVLDVDGTISHIAPSPEEATVEPQIKLLLSRLSRSLPLVAVVSGRSAGDVAAMLGVEGMVYVGNHGLERLSKGKVQAWPEAAAFAPLIGQVMKQAKSRLAWPCLLLEDKGVTASVHYRQCPDQEAARRAVLGALRPLVDQAGLRLTEGRLVVEIRPPVRVDKGTALRALVRDFQLDAVIFVGDDLTDVDGFRALKEMEGEDLSEGIAIGVASAEMPEAIRETADFLVPGVEGVKGFLSWLCDELQG